MTITIKNTIVTDNAYGTIGSGLAVVDTALTFTTGHGARFPAVTSGQQLYCCLLNSGNVLEEIIVTAHTAGSDSATITRGAGATTAKVWSAGDRIEARVSSAVLGAIANNVVSVKDPNFGAVGDGSTDDTTAILAAIAYCKITKTKKLHLPNGVYLINATLDFSNLEVSGEGVNWQSGLATEIRANTNDILMVKVTSQSRLSRFVVNGNGKALWGVLWAAGARDHAEDIEIIKCTEYGAVFGACQNGTFVNINSRFNKYQFVFANGARNCNYYNCTGSIEQAPDGGAVSADARLLYFLIDTSNPHSFGLATSVVSLGNDRLHFFGGIFESLAAASAPDYAIETANPSAYASQCAGDIHFWGCEVDGGTQILKTDSTFGQGAPASSGASPGVFHVHGGSFAWKDQTTAFSTGTAGTVKFYDNASMSGGNTLVERGITQATNRLFGLKVKTSEFNSGNIAAKYALEGGGSTVAWTDATKTFSVSAGSAVQGVQVLPNAFGYNTTEIQAAVATRKPLIRVTFTIANVVGGATMAVYASAASAPFRYLVQNCAAGNFSILYKCSNGNETGSIAFTLGACTSFDVSNVEIELL